MTKTIPLLSSAAPILLLWYQISLTAWGKKRGWLVGFLQMVVVWFTNLNIGRSNTRVHSFWISLRWPFQSMDILIFITFQSVWQEDLFFFPVLQQCIGDEGSKFCFKYGKFPSEKFTGPLLNLSQFSHGTS